MYPTGHSMRFDIYGGTLFSRKRTDTVGLWEGARTPPKFCQISPIFGQGSGALPVVYYYDPELCLNFDEIKRIFGTQNFGPPAPTVWENIFMGVPFWGEFGHAIMWCAGEKGSAAPRHEVRGKSRTPTAQSITQPPGPKKVSGEGRRAL